MQSSRGTLALTMLGSFQALRDGTPITQFRGDKVRALLVYLAIEADRPHTRAGLCGLLWPDQGDDAALHNLSQSLVRLRTALGDSGASAPLVLATRQTVQWNLERGAEVDVGTFARLARAGTTAELEQAAAIYHGPLLPGFSIPGCPEFDEWLLLTREQCERLALATLETLTGTYISEGRNGEAEVAARRVLLFDPWRETAHRQVMSALASAGRRGAALAHYDVCAQLLSQELGVEPDDATTALYESIRDGSWLAEVAGPPTKDVPASPLPAPPERTPQLAASGEQPTNLPVSCELPAPLTTMLGRETELAQIVALLECDGERLVTVAGMGGVGKTRLALAAGHRLAQQADVCWVNLAGAGSRRVRGEPGEANTTVELATAIADALALPIKSAAPVQAQVLQALRGRSLLLILDNLEHLLAASTWLLELLQRAPDLQLLVTSRERLNVDAEVVLPLAGLALPRDDDDPEAASYSAVQLFLQRAARSAPTFRAAGADMPAVVRLCRLLDGVPLGLELAAHWVAHYRVDEIAGAVCDNIGFLATNRREYPERHRSLRAVFGYSWQLLPVEEQHALARLSVFRDSFTRDAAQTVAETNVGVLAALVDKSLLRQAGVGTYAVHELLRQFAAEQLTQQGDDQATHDRHADYFLELLVRHEARLAGTTSREAVAVLRATSENIRAAWYWAIGRRRWQLLLHSVSSLMLYFRVTGPIQAMRPADDALAALEGGEPVEPAYATDRLRLAAALHITRARVFNVLAQQPQAVETAKRALDYARQAGDVFQEARAKLAWALALAKQRVIPQADAESVQQLLEQVISSAQAVNSEDPLVQRRIGELLAESMQFVGVIEARQGRFDSSKAWLSAAQTMCRRSGNEYCLETVLSFQASTFEQEGNFGQGRLYRLQALEHARRCGTIDGEGIGLNNVAWALDYSGEYAAARQYSRQALAIRAHLGCNTFNEKHQHSRIALHQGDFPAAVEFARQALHESSSTGDRLNSGHVLVTLGDALNGMRRWSEARASFEDAIALARRLGAGDDKILFAAHAGLARTALSQLRLKQARMHAEVGWSYLSTHAFDPAYDPLRRYWNCYQALQAVGDPRAAQILDEAYALLMRLAGAIEQPSWRRSFLENSAAHRAIVRRRLAGARPQPAESLELAAGA